MSESIWITWEVQTRNRSMADQLGVPLYELISNSRRLVRYMYLSLKTIVLLRKERPKFLFIQNPSIVLVMICLILKKISKYSLVVDAHNGALFPSHKNYIVQRVLMNLTDWAIANSDVTIVTNKYLADHVYEKQGNPFVFPDPIPSFRDLIGEKSHRKERYALLICAWSDDEPVMKIIEAFKNIDRPISLLITGKYQKKLAEDDVFNIPENIVLLGYVNKPDYLNYLRNALFSVDLTTRENCLVCGAYESASLEVPCIISDTKVNKEVFNPGFVYANSNSLESITSSFRIAFDENSKLSKEISMFKVSHIDKTKKNVSDLREKILNL